MTEQKMPRRKSKTSRRIALAAGIILLAVLIVYLIVKRETIWNIFHIDQIEMRSADEMRTRIKEGDYVILTDTEDELRYTASEGAVTVQVLTDGDEISQMKAEFNAYDFKVNNVSDAEKYAADLLSPYYTDPQIEALVVVIATDIAASMNAETIDYTKEIGDFSMNAAAHVREGNVQVEMTRSGAES